MKITKVTGNDCGGFKPPKGHLDTQMFPECEGTETDRNIVKKTQDKRKKKDKKAFNLKEYKTASFGDRDDMGRNPDLMSELDPSKLELFQQLRKEHPGWSIMKIIRVIKKGLIPDAEPEFPSQKRILRDI